MGNSPNSNIPYELELAVGPITVEGGGNYTLPAATNTTLGGVIVGDGGGLTVDPTGNLTVTPNTFIENANFANTSLAGIQFIGSGALAETADPTNAMGIGFTDYNGYPFHGLISQAGDGVFQFNGMSNLTQDTVVPMLYRGSQSYGSSGIKVVDGDVELLNPQGTNSYSVLTYGYAEANYLTKNNANYLNNSTANSTYTFTDTSSDSRFTWTKAGSPNATSSVRNDWLDNTGRYGSTQWVLKPNTGPYSWLWGGIGLNYNTTQSTRGSCDIGVNFSDNFSAGSAYGRGIKITPQDLTITQNVLGAGVLPAKEWTANSILTQSYADTRYVQNPGNGANGTFVSQDGKTVTVTNGLITGIN